VRVKDRNEAELTGFSTKPLNIRRKEKRRRAGAFPLGSIQRLAFIVRALAALTALAACLAALRTLTALLVAILVTVLTALLAGAVLVLTGLALVALVLFLATLTLIVLAHETLLLWMLKKTRHERRCST
jgi:hypothetical protein